MPQASLSTFTRTLSFSAMLASLLVLFIFFLCVGRPIFADPDIWWHILSCIKKLPL